MTDPITRLNAALEGRSSNGSALGTMLYVG